MQASISGRTVPTIMVVAGIVGLFYHFGVPDNPFLDTVPVGVLSALLLIGGILLFIFFRD